MKQNELPASWVWAPLGGLGKWFGGGTPSKGVDRYWKDGTIPWFSPKDMKAFRLQSSEDRITRAAFKSGGVDLFPERTILMVVRSGILSHTFPVSTASVKGTMNQDLKGLAPHSGINPTYVAYALRAAGRDILHLCSKEGTTVASIDTASLHRFELAIAPTNEQQRIVQKLDELLSDLDMGVVALHRARTNLKRYLASVLKAAVEGQLTVKWRSEHRDVEPASKLLERILTERRKRWEVAQLEKYQQKAQSPPKGWKDLYREPALPDLDALPPLPKGWCWTTVEAVGDVLLGRQRAPQYLTGRYSRKYLRVANIKDDRIDFDDLAEMDFDEAHFKKYRLVPGDILVSEGQSPELLGQSAIFNGEVPDLCFQKTLHRFRAIYAGVSARYAQTVFRAHVVNGVFMRLGSITTNIAHLTLEKFCAAPFPLAPSEEQAEIVRQVESASSSVAHITEEIKHADIRSGRLRQAILKRAFEGTLVPQDPNDEPASELLERLRGTRAVVKGRSLKTREPVW